MPPESSEQLLARFARNRAEADFQKLVRRHLDLVYATALRVANRDAHLAEDISQIVFRDLAAQAGRIPAGTVLAGWLHQHTWFTASKAVRTERRRVEREQKAVEMMQNENGPGTSEEQSFRTELDSALASLNAADRDALVLRFFQRTDFRSLGETLGVSEDAAQKRVSRALDKLRGILSARGVSVPPASLAALLAAEAIAAPAGLLQTVGTAALASAGAGAAAGPLASFFALGKTKAAVAVALSLGIATPIILQYQEVSALRRENAALASELSEMERLRSENAELKKSSISPEDARWMNESLSELYKLRDEVTRLRRDAAAARAAEADRRLAQAASITEEKAPEQKQVVISSQAFEMSPETFTHIRANGFPAVSNPGNLSLVVDRIQAASILNLFGRTAGIDLLSAPRVTTLDGRQARISIEDEIVVAGQNFPVGMAIDVLPQVLADGASVSLQTTIDAIEFLGFDEKTPTIPRFRNLQVPGQGTIGDGKMLLIGLALRGTDGTEVEAAEPKMRVYCITADIVDAAGNLVPRPARP